METSMETRRRRGPSAKYTPPAWTTTTLRELLAGARTLPAPAGQGDLLGALDGGRLPLWLAGSAAIAQRPCVAIVGTRKPSEEGLLRAARLARELSAAGVAVVSGLAEGIDGAAHRAAIDAGGRTIAVIGTPIDKAYPAAHAQLQEQIAADHLLVSQFAPGTPTLPAMFPQRNKLMAAIADATVIVEAGETSGTIHQAAECLRLGRKLFFLASLARLNYSWVQGFQRSGAGVVERTGDILDSL
jgi:DNA processing protein